MKLLLDTHAFIWFVNQQIELSATARQAIEELPGAKWVSVVSWQEMAIKISLNKLQIHRPFAEVENVLAQNGFGLLPLTFAHTLALSQLPFPTAEHRDPFDRLLIAQAQTDNLTLVSRDQHFKKYAVSLLW